MPWYPYNSNWVIDNYCTFCPPFITSQYYNVGDRITTNWNKTYKAINDVSPIGCGQKFESKYRNLSDEFTTYTVVWTPQKITFFVEGREIYTMETSLIKLSPACPLNIIANIQVHPSVNNIGYDYFSDFIMDIDYIKVYKAKTPGLINNFKSNNGFVFTNLQSENKVVYPSPTPKISNRTGSLAINVNNNNELFFRGEDNYIYHGKKIYEKWKYQKIPFNDGEPILVAGNIKYLPIHDMLLYVGSNQRINLFGRSANENSGFYHWVLSSNWTCWWCNENDKVALSEGALQTSIDGEVFYKGLDNKIHWYKNNGTIWVHSILIHPTIPFPNQFQFNSLVSGNIIVGEDNNIYYRGFDGRLQMFKKGLYDTYTHQWIDDAHTPSGLIKKRENSMIWASSEKTLFYIGENNKINFYKNNIANWDHGILTYDYGDLNLGFINGDYAKEGIRWDDDSRTLFYIGFDGRIQSFQKGTSWTHNWVDDNWNNLDLSSYNNTLFKPYSNSSSLIFNNKITKELFYSNYDGTLYNVEYKNCENLLGECNPDNNITNIYKVSNENKNFNFNVKIYPNPVKSTFYVDIDSVPDAEFSIEVFTLTGIKLSKFEKIKNYQIIDISNLVPSIYISRITYDGIATNKLIVKH